ncbi:hypothetical protein [Chromobacterium violaceum]
MSAKKLPWFRMYCDFLEDPKMVSLAFEDQRHFIGILALKSAGVLDQSFPNPDLLDRIVAQKLWIDHAIIRDVKRRLVAAGLIDAQWQPLAWDKRQCLSDQDNTATERKRRQREKERQQAVMDNEILVTRDVTDSSRVASENVTRPDTDTDTDTELEKDKNNTPPAGASDETGKPLTAKDLKARGVDPQHAADFMAIRKAKRAPLTPTALAGIEREAAIAGLTLAQAIQISAERGWQGFKAEWLHRDTPQSIRPTGGKPTLAEQNRAAAEAARKLLFGDDPVEA